MYKNIVQVDKNVNKKKHAKRIFLPVFLHILKENISKKSLEKEISFSNAKAIIAKKEKVYQRYLKELWAIEKLNKAYFDSKKTKRYSTIDVFRMTNSMLEKEDNKQISERQFFRDTKFLEEASLLTRNCFHLGKENGSVSFFIQNSDFWNNRYYVLQYVIENEIKEYFKDKRITGDIEKLIKDLKEDKIRASKNSEMSDVEMSGVICKQIKDNNKINKNSYREFLFRKKTYKEYMEDKLKKDFKVSSRDLKLIEINSDNWKTNHNALTNLEKTLNIYKDDFDVQDICKHFVLYFRKKYNEKIWFMDPYHKKTMTSNGLSKGFNEIWMEFKERNKSKYNKEGFNKREILDFGDGVTRVLDENGVAHKVETLKNASSILSSLNLGV